MPNRMLQIDDLLRAELAALVNREIHLNDGLVTVTKVKCSPDLKYAAVFVSVIPENVTGSALSALRAKNSFFSRALGGKLKIRKIPRFAWKIDDQERYAAQIEKIFDEIEAEKKQFHNS